MLAVDRLIADELGGEPRGVLVPLLLRGDCTLRRGELGPLLDSEKTLTRRPSKPRTSSPTISRRPWNSSPLSL